MVYLLEGFVAGLIIGKIFFTIKIRRETAGKLKEANDSDDHYLFLELNSNPTEIMKRKYVIFKVSRDKLDAPHD